MAKETKISTNYLGFEKANNQKWYITPFVQKPPCKVKVLLENGKSVMYRSKNVVGIDDVVVVGSGCKTSGEMGKVIDNTNTSGGKSRLAPAQFVFSLNPETDDIKKMASELSEISGYTSIIKLFGGSLCRLEPVRLAEKEIEKILFAINILSFKELSTSQWIKKATDYLEMPKIFPATLYSSSTEKYVKENGWYRDCVISSDLLGFYPNWSDDIKNLSIWNSQEADDLIFSLNDELDESGRLRILAEDAGRDEITSLIEESEELNKAYNKLIYFSALAIIIRGGFTNLLEGALSVALPINDFYEGICSFAKEIGSQYCYELISNYDIANIKPKKRKVSKTKKTIDAPKEFSIDGKTLIAYNGTSDVVQIPEGIKIINENAFINNNLKKLILAESVTTIKRAAFEGCKLLEEVVFNKKLSKLGDLAFYECTSLKNIDLSNTSLKNVGNVFRRCYNIESIILPKTLKYLGSGAFSETKVRSVYAPNTIIGIAYHSNFLYCDVTEVNIPAGEVIDLSSNQYRIYYFAEE